jgi:chromosome segregation ATPase
MSIVAKLKEYEVSNANLTAEIAATKEASAKADAEHAATIAALNDSHNSTLAEVNTKNAELVAKVEAHSKTITYLTAQVETISKERDDARALSEKRAKQLSDPAFADAASVGAQPVQAGAGGGADLWPEYLSIKGQTERAKFYEAHAEELDRTAAAHGGLK